MLSKPEENSDKEQFIKFLQRKVAELPKIREITETHLQDIWNTLHGRIVLNNQEVQYYLPVKVYNFLFCSEERKAYYKCVLSAQFTKLIFDVSQNEIKLVSTTLSIYPYLLTSEIRSEMLKIAKSDEMTECIKTNGKSYLDKLKTELTTLQTGQEKGS